MKLPKNIRCVIFDMDGVIIDSEEIHKKAYYETFNDIGVDVSDKLYKTITGSSTINAFQKLVAHFNLEATPEDLVLDRRIHSVLLRAKTNPGFSFFFCNG